MRRIATLTAVLATLICPTAASAAETVFVQMTVMTYWSADGQSDAITVANGTDAEAGKHVITDTRSPSGSVGPGCTALSTSSASCTLAGSLSLSTLDLDDTVDVSATLPAYIDGGLGDDAIAGGPRSDLVRGNDGADVLDGRGGADAVYGGAGDDRIEARDGEADVIDCGAGDDRATVDAVDTTTGCEVDPAPVEKAAEPTPTPPPSPQPAPLEAAAPPQPLVPLPLSVSAVAVTNAVATVSAAGRAALEMGCAATETAGCRGAVYLDPLPAARARHGKGKAKARGKGGPKARVRARMARRGRYGKGPFVIAAGGRARLQIRLSPVARRALGLLATGRARAARRGRRVRARVTVVQKGRRAARSVVELRS